MPRGRIGFLGGDAGQVENERLERTVLLRIGQGLFERGQPGIQGCPQRLNFFGHCGPPCGTLHAVILYEISSSRSARGPNPRRQPGKQPQPHAGAPRARAAGLRAHWRRIVRRRDQGHQEACARCAAAPRQPARGEADLMSAPQIDPRRRAHAQAAARRIGRPVDLARQIREMLTGFLPVPEPRIGRLRRRRELERCRRGHLAAPARSGGRRHQLDSHAPRTMVRRAPRRFRPRARRRMGRRAGRTKRTTNPTNLTNPTNPSNQANPTNLCRTRRSPANPTNLARLARPYAPLIKAWLPRVAALAAVVGIAAAVASRTGRRFAAASAAPRTIRQHRPRRQTRRGDSETRRRAAGREAESSIRCRKCPDGSRCSRRSTSSSARAAAGFRSTSEGARCSRREGTACAFRIASAATTTRARSK